MSIILAADARLKQRGRFGKVSKKEKEELLTKINKVDMDRNNALRSFYRNTVLRNKILDSLKI